jgi:accessory gene regulator B
MERKIKIISFKLALIYIKIYNEIGIKLNLKDFKVSTIYSGKFQHKYCDFQASLGDLLKAVIVFGIGFLLQIPRECLIILITFGLLRYLSGGYHAETFNKCFYQTLSTYIIGLVACKVLSINLLVNNNIISIIFGVMLVIITIYAPKFSEETSSTVNSRYKFFSMVFVIVLYCLYRYNTEVCNIIRSIKNSNWVITALYVGLVLQGLTLTPIFNKLLRGGTK